MMPDTVLLIDANNFIYRGVMTFAPKKETASSNPSWGAGAMPTPKVEPPSDEYVVAYNFFRNLRVLIENFQPAKAFFVLEGHPQFRYDLFSDYKANRIVKTGSTQSESHERFEKALPDILRLLKLLPITQAKAEKYEADDTIATLADNMREEDVIIVSNDTDFIQVLQKGYRNVRVYAPSKKEFMEAPDFLYVAFKSLKGDKSDNIPGVPGIGEKRAEKLCRNPEKLKEFLDVAEHGAHFRTNRSLIEFRMVPLHEIITEDGQSDFAALKEEFARMEMPSMVREPYWTKFVETFNCLRF
jgi:5'-3' exonuclease